MADRPTCLSCGRGLSDLPPGVTLNDSNDHGDPEADYGDWYICSACEESEGLDDDEYTDDGEGSGADDDEEDGW